MIRLFATHPTAANILMMALAVLGLVALPTLQRDTFPVVPSSEVELRISYPGASPAEVERGICAAVEDPVRAVDNLAELTCLARDNQAVLTAEIVEGADMQRFYNDVSAAVDGVSGLPDQAESPVGRIVERIASVATVAVTGPEDPHVLLAYADQLAESLTDDPRITRAEVAGFSDREIAVELSADALQRFGLTISDLATALTRSSLDMPAGTLEGSQGDALIRFLGERRSAGELASVPLTSSPGGAEVTLGDVATITTRFADPWQASYYNGQRAALINVTKTESQDALRVMDALKARLDAARAEAPGNIALELSSDGTSNIIERLRIISANGIQGLVLVLVTMWLFFGLRLSFWVSMGLPVSFLGAVFAMQVFGLTINMISLFALIITLGIVVDDAIVVGEHADARLRKYGEGPVSAAENAARKMAMPVFSATLTTIIAFFGLTAIGGRFGDMIGDIPFTVIAVLSASLVECFLILPNHMSHALAHQHRDHWYDWPSRMVNRGFRWVRDHLFRHLMRLVIWARYPVLAGTILILASQIALFARGDVTWRFFNSPERSSVTGNFAMLPSATREDSLAMMREMQRAVEDLGKQYEQKHGVNPIDYVVAEIGGNSGRPLPGADTKDADLLGGIAIELIDADLRPYSSFAFVADLQDAVRPHPLAETVSFRGWRSGPGGDALDVQFYGASAEVLKQASENLKSALARYPEVSAVEDNLAYDKEELILDLTPQGQALGFTIDGLGRVLRHRLNGLEAATYPDGPRSAAIRVELPEAELTADFLERMQLRTGTGDYVPLDDIVTVTSRSGFSTVRRENGIRLISVTGDISEDDPARAAEIAQALETEILPEIASTLQVEYRLAGLSEQEDTFLSEARTGLVLCLTGIYLVLAWVFASWTRPLVVMAIIPFGLVGTIWGHYIWGVPLSMFTVVGLLGMTGIIINDSIVLVTTIDEYAEDRGLIPSIIDGTADRLRPVMLTTLTTVLGLAPLLYEGSQQAQFLRPTVITLVYGLGFGMVLVLLVVPALVAAQHDVKRQVTSLRHALRTRGLHLPVIGTGAALLGWLGLVLGWPVVTGAPHPVLAEALPMLAGAAPVAAGLALFLVGAAVLTLAVYVVSALVIGHRLRRARG